MPAMPRANRHFLPGFVWNITHRCHRREFLLKFARDRNTVGSETFTREVQTKLGLAARYRDIVEEEDSYALCEPHSAYRGHFDSGIAPLRMDNTRD
jgi:hypothetical protein